MSQHAPPTTTNPTARPSSTASSNESPETVLDKITRITPDWCGPRETIEEQAFVERPPGLRGY